MKVQKIDNQQYLNQPAFKQVVWKTGWNRFASDRLLEHVNKYRHEIKRLGKKDWDIIIDAYKDLSANSSANGVRVTVMRPVNGRFQAIKRFFSPREVFVFNTFDISRLDRDMYTRAKRPRTIFRKLQTVIASLTADEN